MTAPFTTGPLTVILTGPTAVGKSSIVIDIALQLKKTTGKILEIINADSVCFYQEFNIGAAKPTAEEFALVPHHLFNVASPLENYHAGQFLKDCEKILHEIHARGNRAIIVGGSGFYLKALRLGLWEAPATSPEFRATLEPLSNEILFQQLEKIDPAHAKKIGLADRYRLIRSLEIHALSGKTPSELEAEMPNEPNPNYALWVIDREKETMTVRMRQRIQKMLSAGLIEEATQLREKYPESKTLHAVGYQQVLDHLDAVKPAGRKISTGTKGLAEEIELAHRQLAKQQRTWFKNLKPNESFVLDEDFRALQEKLMKLYY
jgi:tRNA dimethylallyltransferase